MASFFFSCFEEWNVERVVRPGKDKEGKGRGGKGRGGNGKEGRVVIPISNTHSLAACRSVWPALPSPISISTKKTAPTNQPPQQHFLFLFFSTELRKLYIVFPVSQSPLILATHK